MSICQFRIKDELHEELKDYCSYRNITITTLLLDYIVATLNKPIQFNDDGTLMEPMKKSAK